MENITLLKEDQALALAQRHLKQFFGEGVDLENVVRRTCLVSYKDDPKKEELTLVSSRIRYVSFVSGDRTFSVFLELENNFKIQMVVNHPLSLEVRGLIAEEQLSDLLLAEKIGWVPCKVFGVKLPVFSKIKRKIWDLRIVLPLNAKMKIL